MRKIYENDYAFLQEYCDNVSYVSATTDESHFLSIEDLFKRAIDGNRTPMSINFQNPNLMRSFEMLFKGSVEPIIRERIKAFDAIKAKRQAHPLCDNAT